MIKISIIIPVYNVEKYLARCLDSCVNQDISKNEYEIIIVNDGSPDGSQAIAEKYVAEYPNIKLINQENGGLSVARNNGFKAAIGQYVWFVDSDDWIVENCLLEIYDKMESEKLDMLQIGYMETWDDGTIKKSDRGFFDGCKTGCEAMKEKYVPAPAQFTVYNRGFLSRFSLSFYPGIYHEDAEFKPRALFFAKRFASLNNHVYYYYQRSDGNIMSSFNIKRGLDILIVCNNLNDFKESHSMKVSIINVFNYLIAAYLNAFFNGITKINRDEKKYLIDKFRTCGNLIDSMKKSKSIVHRMEGWLLTINIPLGIRIINLLRK